MRGGKCPDAVTRRFETVANQPGNVRIILNDKNFGVVHFGIGNVVHRRFSQLRHCASDYMAIVKGE